jgi:hypothetical protein
MSTYKVYEKIYVYLSSGPSAAPEPTRVQRHENQANSETDGFSAIPGAPIEAPGFGSVGMFSYQPTLFIAPYYPVGNPLDTSYKFLFELITGATEPMLVEPAGTPSVLVLGDCLFTTSPQPPLLQFFGNGGPIIKFLGVYLSPPSGGPGPPSYGATIDALNITTGELITGNAQGDFVTVNDGTLGPSGPSGPADVPLTNSGNTYGWVSTKPADWVDPKSSEIQITALGQLGLGGSFCGWLDLATGAMLGANALSFTAKPNKNYNMLACYFNPPVLSRPKPGGTRPTIIFEGTSGPILVLQGNSGQTILINTTNPAIAQELGIGSGVGTQKLR